MKTRILVITVLAAGWLGLADAAMAQAYNPLLGPDPVDNHSLAPGHNTSTCRTCTPVPPHSGEAIPFEEWLFEEYVAKPILEPLDEATQPYREWGSKPFHEGVEEMAQQLDDGTYDGPLSDLAFWLKEQIDGTGDDVDAGSGDGGGSNGDDTGSASGDAGQTASDGGANGPPASPGSGMTPEQLRNKLTRDEQRMHPKSATDDASDDDKSDARRLEKAQQAARTAALGARTARLRNRVGQPQVPENRVRVPRVEMPR